MAETMEIPLTRGQVAIIDVEDWHLIKDYNWCAQWSQSKKGYYAISSKRTEAGKYKTVWMHRIIMKAKGKEVVDHIDGHGLNNTKANLRIVGHRENATNRRLRSDSTSKVAGVSLDKESKKWKVHIVINKKQVTIGRFKDYNDAVAARKAAEDEHYGEFARRTEPIIEEYVAPPESRDPLPYLWYMFGYGEVYCVPLTQDEYAIIDVCDYDKVKDHRWFLTAQKYAGTNINGTGVLLHRMIMNNPSGMLVDHINGDRIDDRRCNLRLASALENSWNTKAKNSSSTGYKNISKIKNSWQVMLRINGLSTYLGRFPTLEEALEVRNAAYREHRGEFARYDD